jgi:hypothetical protein
VIELCNQLGGRVAICPDWHGRVMTSSCDGLDGYSFGLVNVRAIDKSEDTDNEVLSNDLGKFFEFYGGEDQLYLSPDGGVFSVYHNGLNDSLVGDISFGDSSGGFTEGKFVTDSEPPDPEIRMRRSVNFSNVAGTEFSFDISRVVRLMELDEIAKIFGQSVAVSLEQLDTSYVAFQTSNTIVNRGDSLTRNRGLVSLKIRNMLNTGVDSVAIIPFRVGQEIELGPSFGVDFFDLAPHRQLRKLPQAVLLRADSRRRCQVGISRSRATSFLGSVDFRNGNLTLISFNLPECAWECDYLSNAFFEMEIEDCNDDFASGSGVDFVSTRNNGVYLKNSEFVRKSSSKNKSRNNSKDKAANIGNGDINVGRGSRVMKSRISDSGGLDDDITTDEINFGTMYSGEVVRVYNGGIDANKDENKAESSLRYCEFDVFSSASELCRGELISHQQHTIHINADNQTLAFIVNESLGVNYEQTYEKTLR